MLRHNLRYKLVYTPPPDSDQSKENMDINGGSGKRSKSKSGGGDKGKPEQKRRRIILQSDSESEDDYKPGVCVCERDIPRCSTDVSCVLSCSFTTFFLYVQPV